jgi:hypothetical protein
MFGALCRGLSRRSALIIFDLQISGQTMTDRL